MQPLAPNVVTLIEKFNLFDKMAFLVPIVRFIPLALHFCDNDVNCQVAGGIPGLGLLVANQGTDDRDAANVSGNTFIGANSAVPIAMIAATSRCSVTGNMFLNEAKPTFSPIKSLQVFQRSISNATGAAKVGRRPHNGNQDKPCHPH